MKFELKNVLLKKCFQKCDLQYVSMWAARANIHTICAGILCLEIWILAWKSRGKVMELFFWDFLWEPCIYHFILSSSVLTHWGCDKLFASFNWNLSTYSSNFFSEYVSWVSAEKVGEGNGGLVPIRQRAITWDKGGADQYCHMPLVSHSESMNHL